MDVEEGGKVKEERKKKKTDLLDRFAPALRVRQVPPLPSMPSRELSPMLNLGQLPGTCH